MFVKRHSSVQIKEYQNELVNRHKIGFFHSEAGKSLKPQPDRIYLHI